MDQNLKQVGGSILSKKFNQTFIVIQQMVSNRPLEI